MTIKIVDALNALLDKLGRDTLQGHIDEGIPAPLFEHLVTSLV